MKKSTDNNGKRKFNNFKKSSTTMVSKKSKDFKQDQEIKRLKKAIKTMAPPVKTTYSESDINPENVWTAFGVPYPAKGGAANQRLGEKIKVKSLNVRYKLSVSETDDFDTMRVVIIQYMDGNADTEFPLDYQANVWEDPVTSYPYLSPYNTRSASTYRVLYDKSHCLNQGGIAQVSENVLILAKDMAITELKFDTDNGGALAGLDRGIIICWACSDSTASPNPNLIATVKLNFTDT